MTTCDQAAEACLVFPGKAEWLHWSLPDLSKATGPEEERLAVYRAVRDRIRANVEELASHPPG